MASGLNSRNKRLLRIYPDSPGFRVFAVFGPGARVSGTDACTFRSDICGIRQFWTESPSLSHQINAVGRLEQVRQMGRFALVQGPGGGHRHRTGTAITAPKALVAESTPRGRTEVGTHQGPQLSFQSGRCSCAPDHGGIHHRHRRMLHFQPMRAQLAVDLTRNRLKQPRPHRRTTETAGGTVQSVRAPTHKSDTMQMKCPCNLKNLRYTPPAVSDGACRTLGPTRHALPLIKVARTS